MIKQLVLLSFSLLTACGVSTTKLANTQMIDPAEASLNIITKASAKPLTQTLNMTKQTLGSFKVVAQTDNYLLMEDSEQNPFVLDLNQNLSELPRSGSLLDMKQLKVKGQGLAEVKINSDKDSLLISLFGQDDRLIFRIETNNNLAFFTLQQVSENIYRVKRVADKIEIEALEQVYKDYNETASKAMNEARKEIESLKGFGQ